MTTQQVQKLARRIGRRRRVRRNPLSLSQKFFLARIRVVHAIDTILCPRRIVGVRRSDVVPLAARFVQVVVQIRAGRDQAVDVPMLNEVGDDQAQAAGGQSAGHAEENRHIVFQHLLPDAMRGREIAPLEGNPLHPGDDLIGSESRFDDKWFDGRLQEARRPVFRAFQHKDNPKSQDEVSTPKAESSVGTSVRSCVFEKHEIAK